MSQANFVAGATPTINPSVFVVFDTSNPKSVLQATATSSFIIGVSQEFAKYAPIPTNTTVATDTQGDPILVYQEGEECLLNATTAGWTAGDRLTASSATGTQGYGITATPGSSGIFYGAVALTTMSGAGLGQVKVVTGRFP